MAAMPTRRVLIVPAAPVATIDPSAETSLAVIGAIALAAALAVVILAWRVAKPSAADRAKHQRAKAEADRLDKERRNLSRVLMRAKQHPIESLDRSFKSEKSNER